MRALLWIIAIFALAAGLAMLAGANEGYVLLVYPPWRAQASLNLVIVVGVVGFIAAYFLLRLISRTLDLPGRVSAFRARKRLEKAARSMREAVRALYEGRLSDSLKSARVAYASGGEVPEAALIAARAAHGLNDEQRYREWIDRARSYEKGRVPATLTAAELAVAEGRWDDAAEFLSVLERHGHRSSTVLRLSLEVARARREWGRIIECVSQLQSIKAMNAEMARPRIREARLLRLEQLRDQPDEIVDFWRGLAKDDLGDEEFVCAALPLLAEAGRGAVARRAVERLLDAGWNSALARRYCLCAGEGDEAKDALSRAERWLATHDQDAGLLYSLGRQCMTAQIWGKAQSYLESSLKLQPTAETHFALAELFDALERGPEAREHYRLAAGMALKPGA